MSTHLMLMATAIGLAVMGGVSSVLLGLLAYAKRNSSKALLTIAPILVVLNGAEVVDGFWVYALDGSHLALGWAVFLTVVGGVVGWIAYLAALSEGRR